LTFPPVLGRATVAPDTVQGNLWERRKRSNLEAGDPLCSIGRHVRRLGLDLLLRSEPVAEVLDHGPRVGWSCVVSWSASHRLRGTAVHPASTWVWVWVAVLAATAGLLPNWAGSLSSAITHGLGQVMITWTEFARTLSLSTTSAGSAHVPWTVPIACGLCAVVLAFILGWGWLGGVLPTTRGWRPWAGMVLALLWLFAVALATGAGALAGGVAPRQASDLSGC